MLQGLQARALLLDSHTIEHDAPAYYMCGNRYSVQAPFAALNVSTSATAYTMIMYSAGSPRRDMHNPGLYTVACLVYVDNMASTYLDTLSSRCGRKGRSAEWWG